MIISIVSLGVAIALGILGTIVSPIRDKKPMGAINWIIIVLLLCSGITGFLKEKEDAEQAKSQTKQIDSLKSHIYYSEAELRLMKSQLTEQINTNFISALSQNSEVHSIRYSFIIKEKRRKGNLYEKIFGRDIFRENGWMLGMHIRCLEEWDGALTSDGFETFQTLQRPMEVSIPKFRDSLDELSFTYYGSNGSHSRNRIDAGLAYTFLKDSMHGRMDINTSRI